MGTSFFVGIPLKEKDQSVVMPLQARDDQPT